MEKSKRKKKKSYNAWFGVGGVILFCFYKVEHFSKTEKEGNCDNQTDHCEGIPTYQE